VRAALRDALGLACLFVFVVAGVSVLAVTRTWALVTRGEWA
jgi:hypothetical protein